MKTALITGITGQDGSFLAELLLGKGYAVHGLIRRSSSFNTERIDAFFDQLTLHYGDVTDDLSLLSVLLRVRPDEIYNLAAQSHVRVSFDQPIYTSDTVALGSARILEAVRIYRDTTGRDVRFYQASSSEMYGNAPAPQSEMTPLDPQSPYAISKVFAHQMAKHYRESYGLHASCGILFNHESPRRGETFVTRKTTRAVGRIVHGLQEKLVLGNLNARRDWGHARDYVEAMWLMLQQDEPDDYVIATGETYSVASFAEMAFAAAGMTASDYIDFDPRYLRPSEVNVLQGDASKAKRVLGWEPTILLPDLVHMMVEHDCELARKEVLCLA